MTDSEKRDIDAARVILVAAMSELDLLRTRLRSAMRMLERNVNPDAAARSSTLSGDCMPANVSNEETGK